MQSQNNSGTEQRRCQLMSCQWQEEGVAGGAGRLAVRASWVNGSRLACGPAGGVCPTVRCGEEAEENDVSGLDAVLDQHLHCLDNRVPCT